MTEPETFDQRVGARIREYRLARGLSQPALAAAIGFTSTAVSYWETGRRGCTVAVLDMIAAVLEVPTAALLPARDATVAARVSRLPWTVGPDRRTLHAAGVGGRPGPLIGVMDRPADAIVVRDAVNAADPCHGTGWVCEEHNGAHPVPGCDSTAAAPCPACRRDDPGEGG
jgi:DNA-binding XRE family transcriptional regulator